jgi:hypothetical protein
VRLNCRRGRPNAESSLPRCGGDVGHAWFSGLRLPSRDCGPSQYWPGRIILHGKQQFLLQAIQRLMRGGTDREFQMSIQNMSAMSGVVDSLKHQKIADGKEIIPLLDATVDQVLGHIAKMMARRQNSSQERICFNRMVPTNDQSRYLERPLIQRHHAGGGPGCSAVSGKLWTLMRGEIV